MEIKLLLTSERTPSSRTTFTSEAMTPPQAIKLPLETTFKSAPTLTLMPVLLRTSASSVWEQLYTEVQLSKALESSQPEPSLKLMSPYLLARSSPEALPLTSVTSLRKRSTLWLNTRWKCSNYLKSTVKRPKRISVRLLTASTSVLNTEDKTPKRSSSTTLEKLVSPRLMRIWNTLNTESITITSALLTLTCVI